MSTTSSTSTIPTIGYGRVSLVEETGELAMSTAGYAAALAKVFFYIDGVFVGEATANATGRFSATLPVEDLGAHKLVAVAFEAGATVEQGVSSASFAFTLGTANDPGATDWGNFILVSNGETFTTLNSRKDWSVSAPDDNTLRFELHDRDVAYWDFINKAPTERSEVRLVDEFSNGVPLEISYKFNVEAGSRNDAAWLVLGQLHQNDVAGAPSWSPPFEIGLLGERMIVTIRYTGADGKAVAERIFTDTVDIERGHFYDINIKAVFDPNGNGRLVLVRDGVTIADYVGKLGYVGHDGVYWQEGIYRHAGAVLPIAANYKDLDVVTGDAVVLPPHDVLGVDDVAVGSLNLSSTVGVDMLMLLATQDLVDPDTPAAAITLHWQSSTDGMTWSEIAGATGESFKPAAALAGLYLRALATYTDTYGAQSVVSAETVRFGTSAHDTLNGTVGNDVLAGFFGNDTLIGGGGDDYLVGGGGADTLLGGTGDDRLVGGDGADWLDGGIGADDLDGGAGADMLFGGDGADKLSGGAGRDQLDGGDGADRLYGGSEEDVLHGGAGNDFVNGGSHDDTLYGDDGNDQLEGMTGNDTLWGGAGDDHLSGGDGNDRLYGDDGNDRLDGGRGADEMSGGAGDDTYIVDNASDVVIETSNALGGKDSVFASVSYTLTEGVETLNLTGTTAINGTGNDLGNRILGNSAANVLTGAGGQDTISGGAGADTFVFMNAEIGSRDRILDFSSAEGDKVAVKGAFFGLTPGATLAPTQFVSGANVKQGTSDGEGQFLFDTTDGTLYFDEDGVGSIKAIALAGFDKIQLAASDFVII